MAEDKPNEDTHSLSLDRRHYLSSFISFPVRLGAPPLLRQCHHYASSGGRGHVVSGGSPCKKLQYRAFLAWWWLSWVETSWLSRWILVPRAPSQVITRPRVELPGEVRPGVPAMYRVIRIRHVLRSPLTSFHHKTTDVRRSKILIRPTLSASLDGKLKQIE